jgi:hypothetical protein
MLDSQFYLYLMNVAAILSLPAGHDVIFKS